MRTLLEEAVKIVFYKEEDNREIAYNKLKKKIGSARKVEKEKDFPIETTTWSVTAFFFKDLWKANVDKAAARKERIKKEKKKEREAAQKKKLKEKKEAKKAATANAGLLPLPEALMKTVSAPP